MRTRSKTPKPEPVVEEQKTLPRPKAPPRPKALPKPKKEVYTRKVQINHNSFLATVLPDHKKQLTILVISFFRLFNFSSFFWCIETL